MRATPGFEHVEAWASELTLGGALLEADTDALAARAVADAREARRLCRVARQTPATKLRKREQRWLKARSALLRQTYEENLRQLLLYDDDAKRMGDLSYVQAHAAAANAVAYADVWLREVRPA